MTEPSDMERDMDEAGLPAAVTPGSGAPLGPSRGQERVQAVRDVLPRISVAGRDLIVESGSDREFLCSIFNAPSFDNVKLTLKMFIGAFPATDAFLTNAVRNCIAVVAAFKPENHIECSLIMKILVFDYGIIAASQKILGPGNVATMAKAARVVAALTDAQAKALACLQKGRARKGPSLSIGLVSAGQAVIAGGLYPVPEDAGGQCAGGEVSG